MHTTHRIQTIGGLGGYIFRRSLHVATLFIPLLYFANAKTVAQFTGLSKENLLLIIIALTTVFEIVRLKMGWILWGQREREIKNISSFAWTVVSLCVVLLLAPGKQYAIPIIISCACVDPFLGELRRTQLNRVLIFFIAMVVVMLIWGVAVWWFEIDWLLILLMGPMIVMLEWPNFRWIDDNALIQLGALFVVLTLYGRGLP